MDAEREDPTPDPNPAGGSGRAGTTGGAIGRWAWDRNPFVGTREMRGLFVMMVIVSNWDFKTSQNAVYEWSQSGRGRQYIVQDLGASLGRTSWLIPGAGATWMASPPSDSSPACARGSWTSIIEEPGAIRTSTMT